MTLAAGELLSLGMLAELVVRLERAADVEHISTMLADETKWIVPNDRCTILLFDEHRHTWRLYPERGGVARPGRRAALSGAIALSVDRNLSVVAGAEGAAGAPEGAFLPAAGSVMVLPLDRAGVAFGTLNFSASRPALYPQQPPALYTMLRLHVGALVHSALIMAQLRQLSDLKTRLVAGFSHDARNPLAVIAGFAELLLTREDDAKRRKMLSAVYEEAMRLSELVTDVLDLSRIALDGKALVRDVLDWPAILEHCLDVSQRLPDVPSIHTFHVTIAPDLPPVRGDPARIRQALANIVGNAIKYAPAGGAIRLSVQTATAGSPTGGQGQEVVVAVADEGLGIDPAAIPLLFQPFRRTAEAIEAGIKGTGLGLVICHDVAVAHGGRVWVESPGPGQGTTFYFALPAAAAGAADEAAAA